MAAHCGRGCGHRETAQRGVASFRGASKTRTSDVQLHIGKSRIPGRARRQSHRTSSRLAPAIFWFPSPPTPLDCCQGCKGQNVREDNRRAQGACRIRRHGRGGVRPPRRRGDRRADGPPAREPRVSDGQRHAQPRDRRDRENPQRRSGRVASRPSMRCRRTRRARPSSPPPSRPAPPTPTSSSPSAAARSPTAPRRCRSASPTMSAPSRISTGSAPTRAWRRR